MTKGRGSPAHSGGREARGRACAGMTFVEWCVVALLVVLASMGLLSWWQAREAEWAAQQPARVEGPRQLQGRGRVYFVPLGNFPARRLEQLVAYYKDRYGLAIETVSAVPLGPGVADVERRQLIAEELVVLMRRGHGALADDPQAILIGFTSGDMYIQQYTWRFAFAFRADQSAAVVSSARMDPSNYGEPPDPELLQERLRKMVSKQIGILHFGLPQSGDRRSVMYGPILGRDDLDSIGEDF